MNDRSGQYRFLSYLALVTTVLTFALIGLGNVVTRTQSGLGCGDHWPTCNGVWIPDLTNIHVTIEFLHRIVAAGVGFLVLWLIIRVWRVRTSPYTRSIRNLSLMALIVLAVQIVIGGITVRMELPPAAVIMHNGVSIAFFAVLIYLTVRISQMNGWLRSPDLRPGSGKADETRSGSSPVFFLIVLIGLMFAQILLGAYVRQSGSRTGCTAIIPFCQGARILPPPTPEALTHFAHRTLGLIVAAGVGYLPLRSVFSNASGPNRHLAIFECFLVVLQVISGLMSTWTANHLLVIWSTVHLMNAALMLGILIIMLVRSKPLPVSPAESGENVAFEK